MRSIERPTESHLRFGGPRLDESRLGTTLRNVPRASARPEMRAWRADISEVDSNHRSQCSLFKSMRI
jgi:hypothetical protein